MFCLVCLFVVWAREVRRWASFYRRVMWTKRRGASCWRTYFRTYFRQIRYAGSETWKLNWNSAVPTTGRDSHRQPHRFLANWHCINAVPQRLELIFYFSENLLSCSQTVDELTVTVKISRIEFSHRICNFVQWRNGNCKGRAGRKGGSAPWGPCWKWPLALPFLLRYWSKFDN